MRDSRDGRVEDANDIANPIWDGVTRPVPPFVSKPIGYLTRIMETPNGTEYHYKIPDDKTIIKEALNRKFSSLGLRAEGHDDV